METIKVKYFSEDVAPLEYVDGKSDWIDLCAAHHADIYKAVLLIGKQPPQRHDGHGILVACAVTNPQDQPLRPGPQRTALCGNHGTGGMGLLRQQSAQERVAHAGKDHLAVLYLTGRCNDHQLT